MQTAGRLAIRQGLLAELTLVYTQPASSASPCCRRGAAFANVPRGDVAESSSARRGLRQIRRLDRRPYRPALDLVPYAKSVGSAFTMVPGWSISRQPGEWCLGREYVSGLRSPAYKH